MFPFQKAVMSPDITSCVSPISRRKTSAIMKKDNKSPKVEVEKDVKDKDRVRFVTS